MDGQVENSSNISQQVAKILVSCNELYTHEKFGLIAIAKKLGVQLAEPSMHIIVLLLGNHSAGKSTFINWYVGENIQRAGLAVETQGFTLVKHGRRRETLLAEAALKLAPQFGLLCGIPGVKAFLTMEMSRSLSRDFPWVILVDSPGLVDGGLEYPYDVDAALLLLGEMADLVFVFLDPIGQALCRRTVGIVKKLADKRTQPMTFCLTKSDETTSHADRQKVMVQIVQELCRNANLNRQGFEIKSIHIPGMERRGGGATVNQIDELCEEMTKAGSLTVQRTLNKFGDDLAHLNTIIKNRMHVNKMRWNPAAIFVLSLLLLSIAAVVLAEKEAAALSLNQKRPTAMKKSFIDDIACAANDLLTLVGGYLVAFAIIALLFGIFAHLTNMVGVFRWKSRYQLREMHNQLMAMEEAQKKFYIDFLN